MKRNYLLAGGLVVLITVAVTLAFYSHLPETVPVHWNLHGQADRFGPRWEGLVLMPAVMAGVILLVAALPWLSPERYRVNGAGSGYLQVMLILLVFLACLQVTTLASAAGHHLPVAKIALGGVSTLLAALGFVLPRLPRNFYVGVRTPWTLADPRVWEATHRFAAWCFVTAGVLGLAMAFTAAPLWAFVVVLGAAALAPVFYSLMYYKRLGRHSAA